MGAKQGRAKGNEQKAEYKNLGGRHEKSGRRERGDRGSESGDGHRESSCEAEPEREGKEEQRLSSQNPKLRRTKECRNSGGQKVEDKGEPEEAAAEIEAGGRRKEIADEAIR